jgi:hypothetical protein
MLGFWVDVNNLNHYATQAPTLMENSTLYFTKLY